MTNNAKISLRNFTNVKVKDQYHLGQREVPPQPMETASHTMQPTQATANLVAPHNLAPLAHVPWPCSQHQVALTRPGMPFQDTSNFSYCRRFGAATLVDLQTEAKSWSELQPTKIRKLA
jgi:hypothetical protein